MVINTSPNTQSFTITEEFKVYVDPSKNTTDDQPKVS